MFHIDYYCQIYILFGLFSSCISQQTSTGNHDGFLFKIYIYKTNLHKYFVSLVYKCL